MQIHSSERFQELSTWLRETLGRADFELTPASSDASFRRYFRVRYDDTTHIVMDAPPAQEDCAPFVAIARALLALGLNVPEVVALDVPRGFLLLGDLGSRLYLAELNPGNAERLYGDAFEALLILQSRCSVRQIELPPYDRALLLREMELFRAWFVQQHLNLTLGEEQTTTLDQAFELLAQSALEQPQVCVHRDYHSRNLLLTETGNPGIVDFQDAVFGPITYDLVSLLRDCYIAWPPQQVHEWAAQYRRRARGIGLLTEDDEGQFLRWFDWMGVQRHLKAIGIFARLNIRDGKPGYLKDIPRTLGYIVAVSRHYPELRPLHDLLRELIIPRLATLAA